MSGTRCQVSGSQFVIGDLRFVIGGYQGRARDKWIPALRQAQGKPFAGMTVRGMSPGSSQLQIENRKSPIKKPDTRHLEPACARYFYCGTRITFSSAASFAVDLAGTFPPRARR